MKIVVDWFDRGGPHYEKVSVPKWYGLAYSEADRASDIYYPIPLNYAVRHGLWCYWRFLSILYWIGLIDTGVGEMYSWADFYRIKSH